MFLTYIGLSNYFNLNLYFLANSELIMSPVAPLSSNASTIIPSCISILSNLIFTVTSLEGFLFSFLTYFLPSDSNAPGFISVANTLYLLWELSWEFLSSFLLLNCPNICNFPLFYTPTSSLPLAYPSASCSCSARPCAQILHRRSSSYPPPWHSIIRWVCGQTLARVRVSWT